MKEDIRRAFEIIRVAIGTVTWPLLAAVESAFLEIPIGIARDYEVKPSIPVVINPTRARAPT